MADPLGGPIGIPLIGPVTSYSRPTDPLAPIRDMMAKMALVAAPGPGIGKGGGGPDPLGGKPEPGRLVPPGVPIVLQAAQFLAQPQQLNIGFTPGLPPVVMTSSPDYSLAARNPVPAGGTPQMDLGDPNSSDVVRPGEKPPPPTRAPRPPRVTKRYYGPFLDWLFGEKDEYQWEDEEDARRREHEIEGDYKRRERDWTPPTDPLPVPGSGGIPGRSIAGSGTPPTIPSEDWLKETFLSDHPGATWCPEVVLGSEEMETVAWYPYLMDYDEFLDLIKSMKDKTAEEIADLMIHSAEDPIEVGAHIVLDIAKVGLARASLAALVASALLYIGGSYGKWLNETLIEDEASTKYRRLSMRYRKVLFQSICELELHGAQDRRCAELGGCNFTRKCVADSLGKCVISEPTLPWENDLLEVPDISVSRTVADSGLKNLPVSPTWRLPKFPPMLCAGWAKFILRWKGGTCHCVQK